ncbi:hypothetical protein AB0W38_00510 [Aliarcobacter butzleri]|uniref:hypothetical protein n=1 Tax=Aliarcobacter butzleri TaxID=28197 RepID=UPI00344E497D
MNKLITIKEIAEMINKNVSTVYEKQKRAKEFELLKLGAICKKFNITETQLEALISEKIEHSDKQKLELIQKVLNS